MLLIARFVEMARMPATWVTARLNIKSDRGATAVEYGLMLALIAAVIIVAVVFLGKKTSSTFNCTGQSIQAHNNQCT
jgi:pilus assembly protein Flp/PilA